MALGFSSLSSTPLSALPPNNAPTAYTASGLKGSYTYTGQSATVHRAVKVSGAVGSYTFTGQTATVNRNVNVAGNSGTYVFTGETATVNRNVNVSANNGTYVFTGQDAMGTYVSLYPDPSVVLAGVVYGPGGIYTGTLVNFDDSLKLDLKTGAMVKPLTNKLVLSL